MLDVRSYMMHSVCDGKTKIIFPIKMNNEFRNLGNTQLGFSEISADASQFPQCFANQMLAQ